MLAERIPPQELEAEEAVLGSLLLDGQALSKIAYFLKPEDFSREKHRWCFEACLDLYDRSQPIDQRTLASELSRRGKLEAVGGPAFLSQLIATVPTSVHIEHYSRLVHRSATLRRLIETARRIETLGYEAPADVDEAIRAAEEMLYRLRVGEAQRDFVALSTVLERYYRETPAEGQGVGALEALPSSFIDLDKLLGQGLQRSDMIVIAARPSMGKSSFALTIARQAALHHKARIAVFSMEMGREQLADRLIAMHSGINTHRLRTGHLNEREHSKVDQAIGELSELGIWIDDSPVLRPIDMRSKARRLSLEQKGLDLIILDYMQLMSGSVTSRGDNRVQEISEVSRSIKGLARDLNVPVLALSQLSRAVEQRTPHIPQLADLSESGSIEQDADVVMFIYREDKYQDEAQWQKLNPGKRYPKNIAQILVSKHRNGP
ncbi:MAG: replicative DNA helicase, partial [Chloroflexi bacterium]|nr:replicative DNA helicase [Chloroflexota bacterium]